jgi:H+/Cl- antiporter ClcA
MELENQSCPKTWLLESILVTIFCCLPFGIVGIVYASKVTSLFASGQVQQSMEASHNAKRWVTIAFIVGIVCGILYTILYSILGISLFARS